jgi:hypothetical protein
MEANSKIGINTTSEKSIEELKRRINGAQIDLDFYSTPIEFTSVEPQSANHLFGNGKWKKTIIDHFGEDTFQKYSEKYGNKPIDFKITKLITPFAKYFQQNELVQIKDNKGTYSGEIKVLAIGDCSLIIMKPFTCDSTGQLINLNRKKGAENALKRMNQMLTDSQPTKVAQSKAVETNVIESEKPAETTVSLTETVAPAAEAKKSNTTLKIIIGLLITVAIIYAGYKIINSQKK